MYENNTLKFFGHEEGRVRKKIDAQAKKVSYVYDYFIKDHLGNTRVVLTEEQQTDAYPVASMETAEAEKEKLLYSNIDETRAPKPAGYPEDNFTNPNGYVAKLNGNGQKIGPGIVLKVMAGDKFNIRANSWYRTNGANPESPGNPLNELVAALAGGVAKTMSGKYAATELINGNILSPGVGEMLNNQTASTTKPKAGLYWVLFDEQFGYVGNSSGNDFVGSDQEFKQHIVSEAVVNKNGYLYIYVSNETPNIDVFFDNLQVSHVRGALLEETHYYPFGLTMAGISSKAASSLPNRYTYQGDYSEYDVETGYHEFVLRNYDPQLGRWTSVDPAGQYASPYIGMGNNPISFVDPDGGYTWAGAFLRWSASGFKGKLIQNAFGHKGEWGIMTNGVLPSVNGAVTVFSHISWKGTRNFILKPLLNSFVDFVGRAQGGGGGGLLMPVDLKYPITSPYTENNRNIPELNQNRPHRAVDIGTPYGTPIISPWSGKVADANTASYGQYIIINHDYKHNGQNISTSYSHLSQMLVTTGMDVKRGDTIGFTGKYGTGPHLHFVLKIGGQKVNPTILFPYK